MKTRSLILVPLLALALGGCAQKSLTAGEAQEAVTQTQVDTEAQALTSNTVDITTNFTIGQAVEQAASELGAFIRAQLPCADVSVSGSTLIVQYGVSGSCPWHGMTFTGTHTVTISKNDSDEVIVDHTWDALSNGKVEVSGTATVTWNLADPSRHIQHDLTWTHLMTGRTGEGKGDRTQKPLDAAEGGLAAGFTEDGERSWTGKAGEWTLDISGLKMRWVDPVPEAGSLTLDTPYEKTVTLDFSRINASTIHVEAEGPAHSYGFNITSGS
jgi:hypothetical protein